MGLFFVILLLFFGYFGTVCLIMSRADRRWPVTAMMAAALLIYGPLVGIVLAAFRYLGEMGLVLYGFGAVYSGVYWLWKAGHAAREGIQVRPAVAVTLAAYCLALFYITIFIRRDVVNTEIQMEIFHWIVEDSGAVRHFLQNIALFIPLGLLTALLPGRKPACAAGVSLGLLFSVCIETIQLVFSMGTCDIDDIISNTLGALLGAGAVFIWDRCRNGK